MYMNLKRMLPDVVAILFFAVLSFAYFMPAVTEGRILSQHDTVAGIGSGREALDYYHRTGERTRWTNALFGGMPTYQMSPSYPSTDTLRGVENLYHLFLPTYVWYIFVMLLGYYILMRAFDFKVWMAALGAVLWAFSSYFLILISAGHIWKLVTLAYIPPTIAGLVLAYRGRYLWGGLLTAFFVALQIMSNHVQMSYYFLFVMVCLVAAFAVDAVRKGELPRFLKATATVVIAGVIGVCINLSNLYHTYEYSKETMRGKSELVKPNTGNQTGSGLERDYITQWSYGIGETMTLLVPNVKGGASVPLAANQDAMAKADPMYMGIYNQLGQYWGEQPMTSGPVYVGAFVIFLFILALQVVKGPLKWGLVAATVLSILLSWGKNFMGFTDFFLDYVPMYDKFRAVSSILVIAEFTIPLLAMMGLRQLVTQYNKENARAYYRAALISFVLTGGLSLVFAVAPSLFFPSYVSTMEMQGLQQIPADQLAPLLANLTEVRQSLFTADAWRSFWIIVAGTCVLLGFMRGKLKATPAVAILIVLCVADLWTVDKRYLNDEQFVPKTAQEDTFRPTETDQYILADSTLDYRVLNLAVNTFNENNTSYWHKSVGGYHAAKLRRYQELIEAHISPEMQGLFSEVQQAGGDMESVNGQVFPVLNMLNTRYFIFPLQGGKTAPLPNPYALGNAWFVDEVKWVDNANDELEAMNGFDPARTAVVDRKFAAVLGSDIPQQESGAAIDSTAVGIEFTDAPQGTGHETLDIDDHDSEWRGTVTLIQYEPNVLTYEVESEQGGVVVFSEIYYPGWQATIDGEKAEIARANYVLRAMEMPAGHHTVVMTFDPQSLHTTEHIAFGALAVLALAVLAAILIYIRGARRTKRDAA
jgi:hypothetical protein